MNFGYPFTPYATNMGQEQYMGNVGTNPNMQTMDYMPQQAMTSGCGCGMQGMDYMPQQTMASGCGMQGMGLGFGQPGCNQVVQQTCAVDMPYYVNYNTHGNTN